MFPFLILIELFYSYSFIVTAAFKLPPRPPSAFDLHCLANRLSQVLALPLKVWDRKYCGKKQGKERTPVLLSPSPPQSYRAGLDGTNCHAEKKQ